MIKFDLQRFGGKGGSTTNVQSYQPSEYELQLQRAAADYADAVSPNALWLNNVARNVLQNSLGTVQVDFNRLNNDAQRRINQSMDDLYAITSDTDLAYNAAKQQQQQLYNQIPGITDSYNSNTNKIINNNYSNANSTNSTLEDISGRYADNAATSNDKLGGVAVRGDNASDDANARLTELMSKSGEALDKYSDIRDQLINGELPSAYLQNMQDAIAGSMRRTAGEGLNSLANRGILNSSVTEGVLGDIEKNATEAMAGRYLDNISTINSLLGNQTNDAMSLLGQQANIIGQRYNTTGDNLDRTLNVYNTQTANTNNALGQQSNLAQQQLTNLNTANANNANLYNQQYSNSMNSLNTQNNIVNQQYQNNLAKNQLNANTLNSLLGNANANIVAAASAQEAAQQPAANLWNMSLGLSGSNTGALAAAAGKGTTTTTTSNNRGGGLFSGLMGGLFG